MTVALPDVATALDELALFARARLIKAAAPVTRRKQAAVLAEAAADMAEEIAAYFERFAERALPSVSKAVAIRWDPDDIDWDIEERELSAIMATWYATVGTEAYTLVSEQLGTQIAWNLNSRGVKRVMASIATRVVGITDTSREALRRTVLDAIDRGLSIEQLVAGDDGFTGLREMVRGWAGLTGEVARDASDRRRLAAEERQALSRAQTIARTETATAYSLASINGYRDSGLVDEVQVLDGPDCGWSSHDDPDLANGMVVSLDDAEAYPVSHPNCQRAFAPVAAR